MIKLLAKCFVSVTVLMSSLLSKAYAQNGGDDFFDDEDEDYSEPYDEPPRSDRYQPPSSPDQNSGLSRPQDPGQSGTLNPVPRGIVDNTVNEDAVQFKLVDPPKYWKPRKKKTQRP